jgi:hypothetical protein
MLLFSMFSPWQFISELLFILSIVFWVYQISTSIRLAQVIRSQGNDNSLTQLEEFEKVEYPLELPRRERLQFKVRETLRQQLELGEELLGYIHAMRGKYGGYYYLGLSSKYLIIVELDLFSTPLYVRRISRSDIDYVDHKQGMLNDRLVVRAKNLKKTMFEVPFQFKDQLSAFVRILENKTG